MNTVPRPCKTAPCNYAGLENARASLPSQAAKQHPEGKNLRKMRRALRPALLAQKTQTALSLPSSSHYLPECLLTDVVGNRTALGWVFIPVRFGRFGFIRGFARLGSRTVRFAGSSSVPRETLKALNSR